MNPYAEEAEQRWGGTPEFAESQRRTAAYQEDDWERIKSEADDVSARFAALMSAGAAADSTEAMDLAEEHRRHISRWFYDCSSDIHRGLGTMYVDDPRFAANYESVATGLAAYIRDAIHANASR
jgi:hypothetical protein